LVLFLSFRVFSFFLFVFFFNDTATTEIYTLSLHDALPICDDSTIGLTRGGSPHRVRRRPRSAGAGRDGGAGGGPPSGHDRYAGRSEEHTSELQSLRHLVCRLLLEKKKQGKQTSRIRSTHIK